MSATTNRLRTFLELMEAISFLAFLMGVISTLITVVVLMVTATEPNRLLPLVMLPPLASFGAIGMAVAEYAMLRKAGDGEREARHTRVTTMLLVAACTVTVSVLVMLMAIAALVMRSQ